MLKRFTGYIVSLLLIPTFTIAIPEKKQKKCISAKIDIQQDTKIKKNPKDWQYAEKLARNAVVQVHSQVTHFNWLEPYKSPEQKQGCGSGFFINEAGYVLTNFHVVEGAKSVQLSVPALGRKLLNAEIVGVCPKADVALLKVTDNDLKIIVKSLGKVPYLQLGDSDSLYSTEPVLALGYPLGQRYLKSTVGVVAGRDYNNGNSYMHITAPINPGNSGGPLLNMQGKVVGINSAGILECQNIGFIIPINEVKILIEDLYKTKLLRKPSLGIFYNTTTDEHAKLLNCPLPAGVFINDVKNGSVAALAGIKPDDLLYSINGYKIDQYGDVSVDWRSSGKVYLEEFLTRFPLNSKLNIIIYRKGKKIEISCDFNIPEIPSVRTIYPDYEQSAIDYEMIGGLCVMELRKNHLEHFAEYGFFSEFQKPNFKDKKMVIITHLLPGSYIEKVHSFLPGMTISEINGKKINSLQDFRDATMLSNNLGTLSVKTKEKISTVFSIDNILDDEARLARDFMFNQTNLTQKLKKIRAAKKSSDSKG